MHFVELLEDQERHFQDVIYAEVLKPKEEVKPLVLTQEGIGRGTVHHRKTFQEPHIRPGIQSTKNISSESETGKSITDEELEERQNLSIKKIRKSNEKTDNLEDDYPRLLSLEPDMSNKRSDNRLINNKKSNKTNKSHNICIGSRISDDREFTGKSHKLDEDIGNNPKLMFLRKLKKSSEKSPNLKVHLKFRKSIDENENSHEEFFHESSTSSQENMDRSSSVSFKDCDSDLEYKDTSFENSESNNHNHRSLSKYKPDNNEKRLNSKSETCLKQDKYRYQEHSQNIHNSSNRKANYSSSSEEPVKDYYSKQQIQSQINDTVTEDKR